MEKHSRVIELLKRAVFQIKLYKIGIVLICVVIAIAAVALHYHRVSQRDYFSYQLSISDYEYDIIQNPKNTKESCMITEAEDYSSICAFQETNRFMEGHYVTNITAKGWRQEKSGYSLESQVVHYDKYVIDVYDLINRKIVQSIDAKKLIKPYAKEWQIAAGDTWARDVYINEKEESVIYICIDKIVQEDYFEERENYKDTYFLTYNLETGEDEIVSWEEAYRADNLLDELEEEWSALDDFYLEGSFLEANGFSDSEDFVNSPCLQRERSALRGQSGYMILHVSAWALPEDNAELYRHFPGLEKYRDDKDKVVTFFFSNYPQVEDIFPLFLEEGQDISFENVILKAEGAIDGQEHEIHSFEEYYQWRK